MGLPPFDLRMAAHEQLLHQHHQVRPTMSRTDLRDYKGLTLVAYPERVLLPALPLSLFCFKRKRKAGYVALQSFFNATGR